MKTIAVLLCGVLITVGTSRAISQVNYTKTYLEGRWVKVAGGNDDNKNRILDKEEIILKPEPSLYDSLDLLPNQKPRFHGMGIEYVGGSFDVKIYKQKFHLFIFPQDLEPGTNEPEEDVDTMKFEFVYSARDESGQDFIVLIPPIYISMLIKYKRIK